jgi:hypothetical protein
MRAELLLCEQVRAAAEEYGEVGRGDVISRHGHARAGYHTIKSNTHQLGDKTLPATAMALK